MGKKKEERKVRGLGVLEYRLQILNRVVTVSFFGNKMLESRQKGEKELVKPLSGERTSQKTGIGTKDSRRYIPKCPRNKKKVSVAAAK